MARLAEVSIGTASKALNSAGRLSLETREKVLRIAEIRAMHRSDLFDGIVTLTADAEQLSDSGWQDMLYSSDPPAVRPAKLTALPYYLWNNREKGSMQVWLSEA